MSKESITLLEIEQQPAMWQDTASRVEGNRSAIDAFLKNATADHPGIRVVFTGAGTSDYVGQLVAPYLSSVCGTRYAFEPIPTTSIVSNPASYLSDVPTILVSFARSGNSPESVQAIKLAETLVSELYQVVITCAEGGALYQNAKDQPKTLSILLNPATNDKGFAMTSSFSSMTLAALMVFDPTYTKTYTDTLCQQANYALDNRNLLAPILALDFNRVVYLGSGSLRGLAQEAQLKILELTAGAIATLWDSSMGFRHGPKSFIDDRTVIFTYISNDEYTSQYDLDIANEIAQDGICLQLYTLSQGETGLPGIAFPKTDLPDAYQALAYAVYAQLFALEAANKVDNDADNPSATGTVNRVVQGVTIHPYPAS